MNKTKQLSLSDFKQIRVRAVITKALHLIKSIDLQ